MQDWIQKYPNATDFQAVVAANDQMALGAMEALKTSGRLEGVMISGIDGVKDALNAIKAGEMSQSISKTQPVRRPVVSRLSRC